MLLAAEPKMLGRHRLLQLLPLQLLIPTASIGGSFDKT